MDKEYPGTTEFLSHFADFKNSTSKLYNDLKTSMKEEIQLKNLQIEQENCWNIVSVERLDWISQYHISINNKIIGFSFIIQVDEQNFETEEYKFLLNNINPKIPLILLYGVFEPIDTKRYRGGDWWRLCLGYNNWSKANLPQSYRFGKEINIETGIKSESYYWFHSAKYKIKSIFDFNNQVDLKSCIDDIFTIAKL